MDTLKKVICYVVNTISVLLIVAAMAVLLTVVLTKAGETPSIMGYSLFRVVTGSMEPTIGEGSLIVVKKTEASEIKEGDIISFYSTDPELKGAVNTHRVTGVKSEKNGLVFETKGDANLVKDEYPVQESNIIGVVVFISAFLGTLSRLAANPMIFVPIIVIPLVAILVINLVRSIRLAKVVAEEEEEKMIAQLIEEAKQEKANRPQKTENKENTTAEDDSLPKT